MPLIENENTLYEQFNKYIAPSDYHFFCLMQSALSGERFSSAEDFRDWINNWISSRDQEFFFCGNHSLTKRLAKVIARNRKYFEYMFLNETFKKSLYFTQKGQ